MAEGYGECDLYGGDSGSRNESLHSIRSSHCCSGTRNLALQHLPEEVWDSTLSQVGHVTWRYPTLGHSKLALLHVAIIALGWL